jgi:hypothetical protein
MSHCRCVVDTVRTSDVRMWSAALTVVPVVAALLLLPGVADAAESGWTPDPTTTTSTPRAPTET